ncbi:MAG: sulfatase-like hydrolase/transferase, partial [Selenomonadaceae bacterium]|nr:sulfatase-like hydrolase/transferase [Selenomonadaceae bacterium]
TAEYDNAVLYNDFIVDEIIRRFENKNAVLIYISDHGEEVYEGRDFAWHSVEEEGNVHMIEIPALIWASKSFREHYPEKISAINAALDRPYRTDYLIHAILELMDIRTTSFDETKSIIYKNFQERPRIYNGAPYSK